MGRMVWFAAPIVGGFGMPALVVVGVGAAVISVAFYIGRRTAPKPNGETPAT